MKASLQLKLSQQLTLTPQLQQAIRLLQLSTLDLNQEILEAIENNPMLEKEQDDHGSNYENYNNTRSRSSNSNEEAPSFDHLHCTTISLKDHLLWQMELSPFSETDQEIAASLIDAINDDGFLSCNLEELQNSLSTEQNPIELDEIAAVLHRIQRFDPVGCGARNLGECIWLQLNQLPGDTPLLEQAKIIALKHLESLASRQHSKLLRKFKLKPQDLAVILALIQAQNPRPGAQICATKPEYIIPDVIVSKREQQWRVKLNPEATTKLQINNQYAGLVKKANNSPDNIFLKNHLQEARWFMKSIQSRQDTLLKVAAKIVAYQHDFLEHGEEAMKPMILHDIADEIGMHESTISRVTTQKFMHTPRGIFELKYFFSSHVSTNTGGACSSTAIRAVIKKLIAAEDNNQPLSDNKIAQTLAEQGINVARRTIAKYRESLAIPPSHERRKLISE